MSEEKQHYVKFRYSRIRYIHTLYERPECGRHQSLACQKRPAKACRWLSHRRHKPRGIWLGAASGGFGADSS